MASLPKNKKYIYAAAAVVLIVGGYYWHRKSTSATEPVQYKTAAAERGILAVSVSGSGNVIVDQLANVEPTISGTVAGLAVNVGDSVKKGQRLFTIVNDDLSVSTAKSTASLQQSKNSLDQAELNVKQAKADLRAAKKSDTSTRDQKKILEDKIELAEQGVEAAEKSYAATLADYNNQLDTAAKRTVTAPISGTVNAVNIKNGDDLSKLSSGSSRQVPIIIGDLGTLKAQVEVNEVDVPNIELGQKAMMTFGAIDGLTATGKVEKMDALGTLSQGVVTYNVTIGFDTLDSRIKPEMSVSAKIITSVKQDVITVPNGAVKSQGGATYVEVLRDGQKTPQQVPVQIGAANNTDTEITSGVNVGDKVVTQTINPNAKTAAPATTGGGGGFRFLGGGRG